MLLAVFQYICFCRFCPFYRIPLCGDVRLFIRSEVHTTKTLASITDYRIVHNAKMMRHCIVTAWSHTHTPANVHRLFGKRFQIFYVFQRFVLRYVMICARDSASCHLEPRKSSGYLTVDCLISFTIHQLHHTGRPPISQLFVIFHGRW